MRAADALERVAMEFVNADLPEGPKLHDISHRCRTAFCRFDHGSLECALVAVDLNPRPGRGSDRGIRITIDGERKGTGPDVRRTFVNDFLSSSLADATAAKQ